MINCDACGACQFPESELPVLLPEDIEIDESGSPLGKMAEFYETECPLRRCSQTGN